MYSCSWKYVHDSSDVPPIPDRTYRATEADSDIQVTNRGRQPLFFIDQQDLDVNSDSDPQKANSEGSNAGVTPKITPSPCPPATWSDVPIIRLPVVRRALHLHTHTHHPPPPPPHNPPFHHVCHDCLLHCPRGRRCPPPGAGPQDLRRRQG